MSFLQQIIELLSQTPGNIIYHLVILLAMQATLGVAAWQWRRNPEDSLAQRLTWAAAGMIIGRLTIMIAALLTNGGQLAATAVLPPLEHFVDALTAVFLIWALAPRLPQLPRLNDIVLLILLLFSGVIYLFMAQNWYTAVMNGTAVASYNLSQQAVIWSIYQLALLSLGLALVVVGQRRDWLLRGIILFILAAAHLLRLANYPETAVAATDIAYWTRLGNLLALPLLAAFAYRHNLAELLGIQGRQRPSAEQLAHYLQLSRQVIDSPDTNNALRDAAALAVQITPADFAALAVITPEDKDRLRLVSSQPQENGRAHWGLVLSDWPALRLAMQRRHSVELTPTGIGARQLHELCRELAIPEAASLLIEPLLNNNRELGALILANLSGNSGWRAADKALVPYLAGYIAQAISNIQQYQQALIAASPLDEAEISEGEPITGRLIALEKENEAAQTRIETLLARLDQTEDQLFTAQEQLQRQSAGEAAPSDQTALLEGEIATLRESLIEAEEAMAMASASEGGLSAEWVMLALTRYSGELEEAQARIQELERKVAEWEQAETEEQITYLAQELRTPLTSIAGYTDLLLSETMGVLGAKQTSVLRRIEANVEQTETLVGEIMGLLTAQEEPLRVDTEAVDIREMLETAVTTLAPTLRDKGLRLYLQAGMPTLPIVANRNALHQILLYLLRYACQSSPSNGRITVQAQANQLAHENGGANEGPTDFLQVTVSESGQTIPFEDRLQLFKASQRQNGQTKEYPERLADLHLARSLIAAHGGRIWVESRPDGGNVLSALLPVTPHPVESE
jgi:signal transduction histidine kinase